VDSKPSFYVSILTPSQESSISVVSNLTLQEQWTTSNLSSFNNWEEFLPNQPASPLKQDDSYTNLTGAPGIWKKIQSPSVLTQYRSIYSISSNGTAKGDIFNAHAKIVQYGKDNNTLETTSVYRNATFNEVENLKNTRNWTINLSFEPRKDTKFFKTQIWFDINPQLPTHDENKKIKMYTGYLGIDDCVVSQDLPFLDASGFDSLFNKTVQNQIATLSVQDMNPTKITATVNATKPFVLATSYVLDDSWVATVNGQQIKPSPLYLGFVGFQINQTGQFDVLIEYKPQTWFVYASVISIASVGVIFAIYLYISRDSIRNIFTKIGKRKSEASR
ncbi:MAG TPA: hypothetical protein DGG95_06725, partial [Cytophagales bacterium]|nr:hypothetical protein [Cytophagales bacterium]